MGAQHRRVAREQPHQPREVGTLALAQPLRRPLPFGIEPVQCLQQVLPVGFDRLAVARGRCLPLGGHGWRQPAIEPSGIQAGQRILVHRLGIGLEAIEEALEQVILLALAAAGIAGPGARAVIDVGAVSGRRCVRAVAHAFVALAGGG